MSGSVYFVECSGRIKIGFTRNVDGRLKTLSTGAPDVLNLLASVDGSRNFEQAIHAKLAKHRIKGEWFSDCQKVRDLMAAVVARGHSAIDFEEPIRTPAEEEFETHVDEKIAEKVAHIGIEDRWDDLGERISNMLGKIEQIYFVRNLEQVAGLAPRSLMAHLCGARITKELVGQAIDALDSGRTKFREIENIAFATKAESDPFVLAQAEGVLACMETTCQGLLQFRELAVERPPVAA